MVEAKFLNGLPDYRRAELGALESRLMPILGRESRIFTDHSIEHSYRIIKNIDKILQSKMANFVLLTNNEILCLAACCFLHDVGMNYQIGKSNRNMERVAKELAANPLVVRDRHAKSSAHLIKVSAGLVEKETDILRIGLKDSCFKDIAQEIAWICEKHSGKVSRDELECCTQLGSENIRKGFILSLLRLADELDRTYERVDLRRLDQMPIPPESMLHWYIHYYTKFLLIENGIIKLGLRIPNLPAGAPSKLEAKIVNKIKSEVDLVRIPLQQFGIGIQFDETTVPITTQNNLEALKDDVLNLLLDVDDSISKLNYTTGAIEQNWIEYWNLNGNPWFDKLLGAESELLIRTKSMNEIISETLSTTKGPNGGIKLIMAQRRAGKTTLYRVMDDILIENKCNCYYIDTLKARRSLRSGLDLYNFVIKQVIEIAEEISGQFNQSTSEEKIDFKAAYEKASNTNIVIFLDNLDRLKYDDDSEKNIISEFFKLLQNLTDAVQDRWYVLVCVPSDWGELLSAEAFPYLRFSVSHHLDPFNSIEAWELISRRIKWAGSIPEEVITREATDKLMEMSAGLPGLMIQNAELIFSLTAKDGIKKIDGKQIDEYCSSFLNTARRRAGLEAASVSKEANMGLNLLYRFHRDIERNQSDVNAFFRIINNSIERMQVDGRYILKYNTVEVPYSQYRKGLSIVLHRTEEKITMGRTEHSHIVKYDLRNEIKIYLEAIEFKGVNAKTFLIDYAHNPIKPLNKEMLEEQEIVEETALPQLKIMEEAHEYLNVSTHQEKSEVDRVTAAWNAIIQSITSLSFEIGVNPPDMPSETKIDAISLRRQQKQAINNWFYKTEKQIRYRFSTKNLVYYVADQIINVAFLTEKGKSNRKIDPDVSYFSSKAFLDECNVIINNY